MQIVRRHDPFGLESAEVLVFSGRDLAALHRASEIMRIARAKVIASLGPDAIDGDTDCLLAEGEHAFADILGADPPGELFLAEL